MVSRWLSQVLELGRSVGRSLQLPMRSEMTPHAVLVGVHVAERLATPC